MRNSLAIFTVFFIGFALSGCNSNSTATPPKKVTKPVEIDQNSLDWAIKLQSKCTPPAEEGEADKCVALYGFTVLKDGHFQLGPGPAGEMRIGMIDPEELKAISSALSATLSSPRLQAEVHQNIDASGTNDIVTLIRGTSEAEILLKTSGSDLNFQTRSIDEAKAVLTAIRNLALKYYALPFPDACNDGAATLQTLFSSMRTCSADADCAYVSDAFDIIDSNSTQYITTDDCTLIHPLIVGNATTVRSNQTKLQEAVSQVQSACGAGLTRSDCTESVGFQLSGTSPTCQQGVCQINSSH